MAAPHCKTLRAVLVVLALAAPAVPAFAADAADADIAESSEGAYLKLHYFDSRGRAECIRLTLAALQLEYDEVNYARCGDSCPEGIQDWTSAKEAGVKSGLFAYGQVPSLEEGTLQLSQTEAILRYLGRQNDFGPETDAEHERVDLIVGGYWDMKSKYSRMAYNKLSADPASGLVEDYKNTLRTWIPHFERLIKRMRDQNEGEEAEGLEPGQWVAGSRMTFADILLFDMVDTNLRVDADCMAEAPLLMDLARAVAREDGVAAYLASPKRRKFANGNSASFDNEGNPPPNVPTWNAKEEM